MGLFTDHVQRSWSTVICLNICYSVSIISYLETTYVLKEDMDGDYEIPKWMQFLAKLADKFERVFHKISVTENDTYQETYHIKPRNTGSSKSYKRRHYVLQEANRAKSVSGEKLLLAQIHSTLQVNQYNMASNRFNNYFRVLKRNYSIVKTRPVMKSSGKKQYLKLTIFSLLFLWQ